MILSEEEKYLILEQGKVPMAGYTQKGKTVKVKTIFIPANIEEWQDR